MRVPFPRRFLAILFGVFAAGFCLRSFNAKSPPAVEKSQLLPLEQLLVEYPAKKVESLPPPVPLTDAPEENARLVLRNMLAYWRKIDSFKVRTVITAKGHNAATTIDLHAILIGEKPNRFMFRYTNWDSGKMMVSDGTKVRVSLREPNLDRNAQNQYYLEGDSPVGLGQILSYQDAIGPALDLREFQPDQLIALLPFVDSWERQIGSTGLRKLALTGTETILNVNAHRIEFYNGNASNSKDGDKIVLWIAADGPPRMLQYTNSMARYDRITFRDWEFDPVLPQEVFELPSTHGYKRIPISLEHSSKILQEQAPEMELLMLNGRKEKLSAYHGKIILLDFWEVSCGPCRVELPKLEKMADRLRNEGVELLAVTSDTDSKQIQGAQEFMKLKSKVAKITIDDFRAFRVKSVPHLVVLDREGVVRGVKDEPVADLESWLQNVIDEINQLR